MVSKACFTSAAVAKPTITPPASDLCRICSETIFITTGKPISAAMAAASSPVVASRVGSTLNP